MSRPATKNEGSKNFQGQFSNLSDIFLQQCKPTLTSCEAEPGDGKYAFSSIVGKDERPKRSEQVLGASSSTHRSRSPLRRLTPPTPVVSRQQGRQAFRFSEHPEMCRESEAGVGIVASSVVVGRESRPRRSGPVRHTTNSTTHGRPPSRLWSLSRIHI